jgi:hypothetical protein
MSIEKTERLSPRRPWLVVASGGHWFTVGVSITVVGLLLNLPLIFDSLAPPAVTYDNPQKVLSPTVHAGDGVVIEVKRNAWNIFGDQAVPVDVSRQLVQTNVEGEILLPKTVVVLTDVVLGVDPGYTIVQSRLNILPRDLPPGWWRLEGEATARHKSSPYYSDPIHVLPPLD